MTRTVNDECVSAGGSIRRQVGDRVAQVADECGEKERRRMIRVRRGAMLDSAQLYRDLATVIGSSLTELVRQRIHLDQNTRERAHLTAALDTTTDMTNRKNRHQQQVCDLSATWRRLYRLAVTCLVTPRLPTHNIFSRGP